MVRATVRNSSDKRWIISGSRLRNYRKNTHFGVKAAQLSKEHPVRKQQKRGGVQSIGDQDTIAEQTMLAIGGIHESRAHELDWSRPASSLSVLFKAKNLRSSTMLKHKRSMLYLCHDLLLLTKLLPAIQHQKLLLKTRQWGIFWRIGASHIGEQCTKYIIGAPTTSNLNDQLCCIRSLSN